MDSRLARSKGMSETVVEAPSGVPREGRVDFERLYELSRDDVYAYAAGLLRDRAAAEDVTATAFERAYRKRSRYRPDRGSPRAWLFGIARNAALDELRKRGRHADLDTEQIDRAAARNAGEDGQGELRIVVTAALAQLEARERGAIIRPLGDVIILMPPLSISESDLCRLLEITAESIRTACASAAPAPLAQAA